MSPSLALERMSSSRLGCRPNVGCWSGKGPILAVWPLNSEPIIRRERLLPLKLDIAPEKLSTVGGRLRLNLASGIYVRLPVLGYEVDKEKLTFHP